MDKVADSSENGAREMKFCLPDEKEDGEYTGVG